MVEVRIEFDDDDQYERLKELKNRRGLTWKGLLLEGEMKVREETPE
jgi:adenylate cyclase class IV